MLNPLVADPKIPRKTVSNNPSEKNPWLRSHACCWPYSWPSWQAFLPGAAGNALPSWNDGPSSDGDLQMLQWTAGGDGPRLMALIHHTDGEREWAYDRQSSVARLDQALDEAQQRGWTVVDMKRDWNRIFP